MIRRCITGLAILLALFSGAVPVTAAAAELVRDSYVSPSLGRKVHFTVFLPTGYQDAKTPYPLVYLLHGAGGDDGNWTQKGGAFETLDGLIRRGDMRASVAVMPSYGPDTWWVDGAEGKVATAFIEELLPLVEARYKVAGARNMRSIAGLSMGGYGALNFALAYPQHFCAAGVISGAVFDPVPPTTSKSVRASAYNRDGKFDEELWKSLNYPARLDAYSRGPWRVPVWIAAGDHDALGIALESARLFSRLFAIQPKQVELRIVDGDHEWMVFRDALPDTLRYISRQCAASP